MILDHMVVCSISVVLNFSIAGERETIPDADSVEVRCLIRDAHLSHE